MSFTLSALRAIIADQLRVDIDVCNVVHDTPDLQAGVFQQVSQKCRLPCTARNQSEPQVEPTAGKLQGSGDCSGHVPDPRKPLSIVTGTESPAPAIVPHLPNNDPTVSSSHFEKQDYGFGLDRMPLRELSPEQVLREQNLQLDT